MLLAAEDDNRWASAQPTQTTKMLSGVPLHFTSKGSTPISQLRTCFGAYPSIESIKHSIPAVEAATAADAECMACLNLVRGPLGS